MTGIDTSLQWFRDRQGKVAYSMTSRSGPASYDCSSSVYYALIAGGLLPSMRVGNTDSLFPDLERNGWVQVKENAQGNFDTQKGDVFIWGRRGASGGSSGHTGQFTDANNIIHCSYGYNGIAVSNYDWLRSINGYPEQTFYRFNGQPPISNPIDQDVEVGSFVTFPKAYRVDDVQKIGGVWQVRTNELCKTGFSWDDNGIPADPLIEVDVDSYRTVDQDLSTGSLYVLPGKFQVLDVGFDHDAWLAQVQWNNLKFWVDLATMKEVSPSDPGTKSPGTRPIKVAPVQPPKPSTAPDPIEVPPTPVVTQPTAPAAETKPKEDRPVAFTQEQEQQLNVATQRIQDTLLEVSQQGSVQEIVGSLSKRVKTAVYLVGDTLIGAGLIVPGLAVVFDWTDVAKVAALAGVLATAGAFILTMFGIYKSGAGKE